MGMDEMSESVDGGDEIMMVRVKAGQTRGG
jgi:hypothetical protein